VAAHVLNFKLQLRLGALLSALEGQVLEEVCGTVGLVGLGARAGINPDTDSAGLGVGGVLGRDLEVILSASDPAAAVSHADGYVR
jgi:hypothetical protein